jgi:hypothetical protein
MRSITEITTTAFSTANPGYAIAAIDSATQAAPAPIRNARIQMGELTERSVLSIFYYLKARAFKR